MTSFIELAVTVVGFGIFIIYSNTVKRETFSFFAGLERRLSPQDRQALSSLPLAVCVTNDSLELVWYNEQFSIDVLGGDNILGGSFSVFCKGSEPDLNELYYKGKRYSAFSSEIQESGEKFKIFYFVDDTELKERRELFFKRRPSVIQIVIDNYKEFMDSVSGSEKNLAVGRIESILENVFINESGGLLRKLEKDRFVAVVDNEHLSHFIEDKFSILDVIHKSTSSGHVCATLSMGIGKEAEDIRKSDTMARQALDMALGRGGDQVAIKSEHGYEFFGGISKGVEKQAKVRSRMIASALSELLSQCDNVIIMGHKMADFDCVGAAVGLCKAVSSLQKPAHICINTEASLSQNLIEYISDSGYRNRFIDPENALNLISKRTLLIVVDTHNPDFVECPELLEKTKNIVVIDHHRKMVNFIENAVIFYHEPSASSTCEMATELVEYFGENVSISKCEAEALLSGIMLDTKNFIIKSGVRTFEAAAFLRRIGADLVRVNSWFASSIETYHQRAALISAAEIYKGCAISSRDEFSGELLLAVPQTADELLHIQNVDASFVMYRKDSIVYVSARSFGTVNVQLVMEKLGGGGHLTMAGAQIQAENCEEVKALLIDAIDSYFSENSPTQK